MARPRAWPAAIAGLLAGAAALGIAELASGIVPGAPSPVTEIGRLLISLQPPGTEQVVVGIFGKADKLALNVAVTIGALLVSAGLGVLARTGTQPRFGFAIAGFAALGLLALVAALGDPLVDPVLSVAILAVSLIVTWLVLVRLLRLAAAMAPEGPAVAEMPNWSRRRFIGTSIGVGAGALAAGAIGRVLVDARAKQTASIGPVPAPVETAPPLNKGEWLNVNGITPIVVSNDDFYRIDTQLLTPRLDASTWKLTVSGMVDNPLTITYADLLKMPLHEEYLTIQCVSNEVGGDLVGNALWRGVRLREVLDKAGVQAGATQIVGRAFDGWTAGFPTSWLTADREALIVVGMNGQTLPPAHGFPARLMVPGLYGYVSATKWLTNIELTTLEAFDAYWVPLGWAKYGPIKTASRIDVPKPGSRPAAGIVPVAGVAWAPDRGISKVEIQVDGGNWQQARLSDPISKATWVQWLVPWQATSGQHTLRVRATDGEGNLQVEDPHDPAPNGATGYHSIQVTVA